MNLVSLIGRLTRDAELSYTDSGFAISKLSVAVNERKKTDSVWVSEVHYFDCVIFGKRAESLDQYLVKGQQIGIVGGLRQERWESKDGKKMSRVTISVGDIELIGGQAKQDYKQSEESVEFTDDIPF